MSAKSIWIPYYTEAALLGAAILSATGSGIFNDVKIACKNLIKIEKIYEPDLNNAKVYNDNFHKYTSLYESVEKLF